MSIEGEPHEPRQRGARLFDHLALVDGRIIQVYDPEPYQAPGASASGTEHLLGPDVPEPGPIDVPQL